MYDGCRVILTGGMRGTCSLFTVGPIIGACTGKRQQVSFGAKYHVAKDRTGLSTGTVVVLKDVVDSCVRRSAALD